MAITVENVRPQKRLDTRLKQAGDAEGSLRELSTPTDDVGTEDLSTSLKMSLKVIEVSQEQLTWLAKLVTAGELVSGVAHEINNPLALIIGYSELLLRSATDEPTRERLQLIFEKAHHAYRMVDDIFSFARQRTASKSLLDVRDPLERALGLRSYRLRVNNIEVVKELSEALPMTLADDHQLAQVFLNLLTNAEQVMSSTNNGGRLTIRATMEDDYIMVTIEDNGSGIAPEHLNEVFDPFFTARPAGNGGGLGLNICRSIVEEHGGKIWVDSEPGRGAAFHVGLPVINDSSMEIA